MTTGEIAKRLSALERELAALKANGAHAVQPHPIHALEGIHGTFENDAAFREAMRLGRQWRNSERAASRKSKAKRK